MLTDQYDTLIKEAVRDYLPGYDWRLIKAQLIAESHLNPRAVSEVGARGIAQFMPATWKETMAKMGIKNGDIEDPKVAIPACCFYMHSIIAQWTEHRPETDKICLALASYNAGMGNLLKAQSSAGNVADYARIVNALPRVTGTRNAAQTSGYVERIYTLYLKMVLSGA